MQKTTNFGFNKPDKTEKYNVETFNENFELIDTELKAAVDKAETSVAHPSNKENPHEVTKEQVGLGNVPNLATNDQTPTYVVASENAALSSGEKLSVAFGKIAKAISSLISHLSDTVGHITSAERTTWNSKANGTHTHTKSQISDFPTTMTPTAHTHDDRYYTETETNNLLAQKQANLGYTPVRQGSGTGQLNNTVFIGWSGTRLKGQVDTTDLGNFVFDGQLTWGNVSGKPSSFTPSSHTHTASQITGTVPVTISASQPSSGLWVVP